MLPNDPLLGLAQSKATMAERIHRSGQERLAAAASTTAVSDLAQVPTRRIHGFGRRSLVARLLLAAGVVAMAAAPFIEAADGTHTMGSIANRTLSGGVARDLSSQELVYVNRAVGVVLGQ